MNEPPPTSRLTQDDFQAIIDLVVAYTGREPDRTLIETWAAQAAIGRWTYPLAARAIHMWASDRDPRDFLEPANVTRAIRAIRRKAAETFKLPVIPDGLPNADYPAWLRARREDHISALTTAWAATGTEPPVRLPPEPAPDQIGQRRLAELTANAFHDMPSAADSDGNPPTPETVQVRSSAFAVACPYCGARPDDPCTRSGAGGRVRMSGPHPARVSHIPSTSEEAS